MLKNLTTIGQELNKQQQQSISGNGGCFPLQACPPETHWNLGLCACIQSNS
ncbi:hypothetical protein SAMN04489761_1214 [Tenacibaculum sp. MAR_2009_124]|uniref:hypothetical protein n=1 Tax=Tenacibaculum sp. MAR_2009_124 TaxID=1250059 RepID=UPI00089B093B|nr:hypothetical protein [Tenacibaculum sp. MAR_2009_124]SEB52528.1 hypothetical protein SAMN04489761_1214 [Tenacibaculum sp. MAR_2009_124]